MATKSSPLFPLLANFLHHCRKSDLLSALLICCFITLSLTCFTPSLTPASQRYMSPLTFTISFKQLSFASLSTTRRLSLRYHPFCLVTTRHAQQHPSCCQNQTLMPHTAFPLHPPSSLFSPFIFSSLSPSLFASLRAFSTSSESRSS